MKTVFVMNVSRDEDDEDEDDGGGPQHRGAYGGEPLSPSSPSEVSFPIVPQGAEASSTASHSPPVASASPPTIPTSQSLPNTFPRVDIGTDALQVIVESCCNSW